MPAPDRQRDKKTGSPRLLGRATAARLFDTLAAHDPEPVTALVWHDPFGLLVAVVLSAQATDEGVNKVTPGLLATAPDPASMAALGAEGIEPFIRTLGLWRAKARHLAELARILAERHQGRVPQDRAALEALPGVGRKTASVVLSEAFGEATLAVDTHVYRVARRTGLAGAATVRGVEDEVWARTPARHRRRAHHLLIRHGRRVCRARRPLCESCPVAALCLFARTASVQPAFSHQGEAGKIERRRS